MPWAQVCPPSGAARPVPLTASTLQLVKFCDEHNGDKLLRGLPKMGNQAMHCLIQCLRDVTARAYGCTLSCVGEGQEAVVVFRGHKDACGGRSIHPRYRYQEVRSGAVLARGVETCWIYSCCATA